jgi:DNA polymerase-3 subunit gamma/tau
LEAISAGQTAAVVEETNTLLNAGNSPAALARQFVRYLRNALMARVGGENSDLLQISADERARATRSAMLFSEEDLTRFLQVMLRTFDDLNYRQEQRFHLELGLVKLVHLQRLLPVEELLSQLPSGGAAGSLPGGGSGAAPRGATTAARPAAVASRSVAVDRTAGPATPPRLSPLEADRDRKTGGETGGGSTGSPVARAPSPAESVGRAAAEAKSVVLEPKPAAAVALTESEPTEGALALAADPNMDPGASSSAAPNLDRIRNAVCAALAQEGHETAANLLLQGTWTGRGGAIQVELAVRKAMLTLTVNAEAEAICKKAMRAIGATQKIAFVPGENGSTAKGGPANKTPAITGSAQAAALENPLVRKTQELFRAEIRSVLDLREPH